MLGTFNNWNTIKFINKTTAGEEFDEVNKVFLDVISANMELLVQTGKYGATNAADPTAMVYYILDY